MRINLLCLCLVLISTLAMGQTSLQDLYPSMGKYHVGFTYRVSHDSSRTYQRIYDWDNQFIPRPVPISIWYPSESSTPKKLTVLDYMRILKEEEEWEHLPDEFILNWFYYPNTPQNQKHLEAETNAYHNAKIPTREYPVIIYSPSYEASSIENFALCEYLASHGYVVISSPSRGTGNRFFEGGTLKDAETQARDIQYLIKISKSLPYANQDIASIGFSFGGLSNVLASATNKEIKAVVSLDGSIKYQYKTALQSPFFDVSGFDIPFLQMSQKDIPMEVMLADNIDTTLNNAFDFFEALTNSHALHFKFHYMTHAYFSTLGVLFQPRDTRQDKSDLLIMESHRWMSEFTLSFLNSHLKGVAVDWAALSTPGAISLEDIKEPLPRTLSFQDFNELAADQGYQNLFQLFEELSGQQPGLEIPEGRLNNLGLQLVFNPRESENGIRVLSFATQLYPESANLYDSLAEGYLYLGYKDQALNNFRKSIELDSGNQNAINRIRELSK